LEKEKRKRIIAPKGATMSKINEVIDSGLWSYLRADVKEWYTFMTGINYDVK
jgi:hypothetical protein